MKQTTKTLSIVIPVYNEEDNINILYNAIIEQLQVLDILAYEIVFVDDGSRDMSLNLLQGLSHYDPNIVVIILSRNFGYEYAVQAGLRNASGDWIMIMDADLQDPPSLIQELYHKKDDYDIVLAKRSSRNDGRLKDITAWFFYRLINILSDFPIPQDVGYCRIFSRQVGEAINQCNEHNRFLKGLFSYVGFHVGYVMYDRPKRQAGKTSFTFKKLMKLAGQAVFSLSTYPLKISMIVGIGFALWGFVIAIIQIILKILYDNHLYGISTTIVLISILGGIQLISLGIIGEYIARIYAETKVRPNYIIKETIRR